MLAGRKTVGTIGGSIRVNGVQLGAVALGRFTGFAEQQDVHLASATVTEALEFSCSMRLAGSSPAERSALVKSVIELLELQPLAGRMVGSLSPAETKRLTIGVELSANPAILFLDEPTTGLDARSAAVVMRAIRNVASTGRTVVCTVHQPSAELFFAFDALLLLAPGGFPVYVGPLGHRGSALVEYLQAVPGVSPLPKNTNPGELDGLEG